jgi:hypothetical protein
MTLGAVAFWLVVGHAFADYILQPAGVNYDKNPNKPPLNNGAPRPDANPGLWMYAMTAHCLMNAGAVAFATGSVALGCCEFAAHFLIDLRRCDGRLSRTNDQILHLLCKAAWLAVIAAGIL